MKLNQKQKIIFLDNIASLLNSGIPVIQAFDIISFQLKNNKAKAIIKFMKNSIISGESFYSVASKLRGVFNVFDIAMIETGEATGQIGKAFEIIVIKEEKEFDLKRKVKQALMYPIIIILVTLSMLSILMIYVIPKIEGVYRESNVNLPGLTVAVINTSHFFVNNLIFIVGGIVISILLFLGVYKNNKKIKKNIDKNIIRIPLFGEIIKKKILINICDFMYTLLSSGIIINKALIVVKNAMDNDYYKDTLENISQEVKVGNPLSQSMGVSILENNNQSNNNIKEKNFAFPIELSTAVKIGEQTGTLAKMLHKVSIRYTKEIDNTIKNLTTILEPIIIVVIGIVVGIIIMAILLPFLNIANVVK